MTMMIFSNAHGNWGLNLDMQQLPAKYKVILFQLLFCTFANCAKFIIQTLICKRNCVR